VHFRRNKMKSSELLTVLDEHDRDSQVWLYTPAMLRILFPDETTDSLKMSLRRHVKSRMLRKVKKGLYANERARCSPSDKLSALVPYLKPGHINYVSKENRLSELGVISQMPLDHLSVMTSGTSQTFKTCYGTVEFTHTQRPIQIILEHTEYDPNTGLLLADQYLAMRDINRSSNKSVKELIGEQRGKESNSEKII